MDVVVIREVPVWYIWLAMSPGIFALGRRFPLLGRRWFPNALVHLVASAVFVMIGITIFFVVIWPLFRVDRPGVGFFEAVWRSYRSRFAVFMIVYFAILTLHQALDHYREAQRKSLREAHLETMLERSRRDLLRMQLHPHFLFNTLHAVSALMERDTTAARRMITRLSDLLRLSLENDAQHEVTLEEEMEFLDKYLEIQRIRFGDRLSVDYRIDDEARNILVPRLLLQPLAENAITHGLSRMEGPGTLTVEAVRNNGRLVIRVLDDGPGVPDGGPKREGVGLGNTRQRLEHLYGDDQRLTLANRPEGGCEVRVEVPAATE